MDSVEIEENVIKYVIFLNLLQTYLPSTCVGVWSVCQVPTVCAGIRVRAEQGAGRYRREGRAGDFSSGSAAEDVPCC